MRSERAVQRLFSTFADGWPGLGLLFQRILTALILCRLAFSYFTHFPFSPCATPTLLGFIAGILLLVGVWTPIAGVLVAGIQVWDMLTHSVDPWVSITVATLGVSIAMIGPGAWSLDARLFGRRHMNQ